MPVTSLQSDSPHGRKRKSSCKYDNEMDNKIVCKLTLSGCPSPAKSISRDGIQNGKIPTMTSETVHGSNSAGLPSTLHLALKGNNLSLKQKTELARSAWLADPVKIGGLGFRHAIVMDWLVGSVSRPPRLASDKEATKCSSDDYLELVWNTLSFCLSRLNGGWMPDPTCFNAGFWNALQTRLDDETLPSVSKHAAEVLRCLISGGLVEVVKIPCLFQLFVNLLKYILHSHVSIDDRANWIHHRATLDRLLVAISRDLQFRPNAATELKKLITLKTLAACGCLFSDAISVAEDPEQAAADILSRIATGLETLYGFCFFGRKPAAVGRRGAGGLGASQRDAQKLADRENALLSMLSQLTSTDSTEVDRVVEFLPMSFPVVFRAACSSFLERLCDETVVTSIFSAMIQLLPVERNESMRVIGKLLGQLQVGNVFGNLDIKKNNIVAVLDALLISILNPKCPGTAQLVQCAEMIMALVPDLASKYARDIVLRLNGWKKDKCCPIASRAATHSFVRTLARMKQLRLLITAMNDTLFAEKLVEMSEQFLNNLLLAFGSSIEESHPKQIEECLEILVELSLKFSSWDIKCSGPKSDLMSRLIRTVIAWTPIVSFEKLSDTFQMKLFHLIEEILANGRGSKRTTSDYSVELDKHLLRNFLGLCELVRLQRCSKTDIEEKYIRKYGEIAGKIPVFCGTMDDVTVSLVGMCAVETIATKNSMESILAGVDWCVDDVDSRSLATIQCVIERASSSTEFRGDWEFYVKVLKHYSYFEERLDAPIRQLLISRFIDVYSRRLIYQKSFSEVTASELLDNSEFQKYTLSALLVQIEAIFVHDKEASTKSTLNVSIVILGKLGDLLKHASTDTAGVLASVVKMCRKMIQHSSHLKPNDAKSIHLDQSDRQRLAWCLDSICALPFEANLCLTPVVVGVRVYWGLLIT